MASVKGRRVKLAGTGRYIPEKVMHNRDFEKFLDTSDEWIRERTGITTRHFAAEDQKCSDLAYLAAVDVLNKTGIMPEELDMVIVGTNSPDSNMPAMACKVQGRIGAVNAGAFDLQAGCTGSLVAMQNAIAGIACGMWNKVLVIASERFEDILDWKDRGTCILFGDGAGACVLSAADEEESSGIISVKTISEGLKHDYITTENEGEHQSGFLRMKGRDVFKYVSNRLPVFINTLCEESDLTPQDVNFWVFHQANTRIIDYVFEKAGLSSDRTFINIDKYGNTSAASMLIALDEAYEEGKIKKGEKVALLAFGAGMTIGGLIYEA